MKNLLLCAVLLFLSSVACGQDALTIPVHHHSKRVVLLTILQLAANGADTYFSARNMGRYGSVEHDPLAQPFMRNKQSLIVWSAAGTGGALYGEHWLRVHGHGKWADAIAVSEIAGHTVGAAYSEKEN